tara:strand:- start:1 stop:543 length:543 start_codon:yes stop_codon:yes gene_type:complete
MTDNKVWEYESNKDDKLAEKVAKDKTIVMTKPSMAKYLIDGIEFIPGEKVIEPCKGDGAFYDNLPDNVETDWCEINDGKDFLQYDKKFDVCISNPPFIPRKLFWAFNEKAMELCTRKIYWLINLHTFNVFTPKRLDEMKEKGWFIQKLHIVADTRWFGRYALVEIGKTDLGFIEWKRKSF